MTELIVLCTLVGVGEDLIRLVYLLKAGLARLVAWVQVGVIFLGKLPICFFKLIRGCGLAYAENLIVISFFCHKYTSKCGRTGYAHIYTQANYFLSSSTTV